MLAPSMVNDNYQKLSDTGSICHICKNGIAAEIYQVDGKILMHKICPEHGAREVLISSDAEWYHRTLTMPAVLKKPVNPQKQVETGCPFDCGACTSHEQKVYLPVIPITSSCNLNCPICYTINKNDNAFHISIDEFKRTLEQIKINDPDLKIINLTGGEPTLHPQFMELIRICDEFGFHRTTISTHGLTFAKNEEMVAELAELNARIVLSFNSFKQEVWEKMIGAKVKDIKLRVLDIMEQYDLDTTLIPVIASGCNDQELGQLIDLMWNRKNIRSLEIHTMTFTGQGGLGFDPTVRLTTPDVLKLIESFTQGKIKMSDFIPSPCAHPLCYQTCYLLDIDDGNHYIPFPRFMDSETVRHLLTDNLYMEPGDKMERTMQQVMMNLWSSEIPEQDGEQVLKAIKNLLKRVFTEKPLAYSERQQISERSVKSIYIHSHMDDDNFDTNRIRQCSVGVPSADGTNIPTCSYNILYRGRDQRFSTQPLQAITDFKNGKKWR